MDRAVPYDLQAERATLGSILQDGAALEQVDGWLSEEYFYYERHAWIYDAIVACASRREPPDPTTVAAELRRRADGPDTRLEAIGGLGYLLGLVNATDDPYRVEHYARIVERTAVLRRLIETGGKISALGYDEAGDLDETLDRAEAELFAVSQRRESQGALGVDLADAAGSWWQRIERLQKGEEDAGVATGWREIDDRVLLRRGQFHLIAARPGIGKTTLALALTRNVARRGEGVDYYSLEMSRDIMQDWLYGMEAGVDADRIQRGRLNSDELRSLAEATGRAAQWPIHLVDRFQLSHLGLRGYARRRQAKAKPSLLIIDHIGLLSTQKKAENRNIELGEITRGLVNLALELDVAIVALSQLNRDIEKRATKIPTLADLRDSGNLEQDAATVLFLHRPAAYGGDEPTGLVQVHCGKNRNRGGVGWTIPLEFDPLTMYQRSNYQGAEGYD